MSLKKLMFDVYLIDYIKSFLIKSKCNKMNLHNEVMDCCICNEKFCKNSDCEECKNNLIDVHSFYKSKYCRICYNLLLNY